MAWSRSSLVLLALVACKPKGLLVEVKGDNVELFVATDSASCGSDGTTELCPMSPPPNMLQPDQPAVQRLAKRWIVNTDGLVTADRVVTNGVTRFLLSPDPDTTTVPAMLAVAFDGPTTHALVTGFLVVPDVDVQAGKQERLQLALEPFVPLSSTTVGGEALQLWRKPSDSQANTIATQAPCVLVGHGPDAAYPFESFSPPGDTDCDETEKVRDCDPFAAFNVTRPTEKELTCVTSDDPSLCIIGGVGCRDGVAPGMADCMASPEPYCTSSAICHNAAGTSCSTVGPCLTAAMTQLINTASFGLRCSYNYGPAGPCDPTGTATVAVKGVLPALVCTNARISAPDVAPLAFGTNATLGSVKPIKVSVHKSSAQPDCTIDVTVDATMSNVGTRIAYIEIQTDTPTTTHHVFPIKIEGQQSTCTVGQPSLVCDLLQVDPGDAVRSCR